MRFDAVLFDLFGTIIPRPERSRHKKMMRDLAEIAEVDSDLFADVWISTNRERVSRYGTDTDRMMKSVLDRFDLVLDQASVQKMTKVWYDMTTSHFYFFDDVIPAFEDLKRDGMKIGLLTNCGPIVPELIEGSEIRHLLDAAVYSTIEGFVKPDPEIYLSACGRLATEPSQTLFIGDGDSDELRGAYHSGLTAVKVDRGSMAGNYRIAEDVTWDPTISDFEGLIKFVQAL